MGTAIISTFRVPQQDDVTSSPVAKALFDEHAPDILPELGKGGVALERMYLILGGRPRGPPDPSMYVGGFPPHPPTF